VDFHWLLDTRHGADYFRRWHRFKRNSGGLMVHKATHHFDLVNWWLSSVPETVYAMGSRDFYRPETAKRYGLSKRANRCRNCAEFEKCSFYLNMESYKGLKKLYLDNEQFDGYYRDQCVFGEDIDIADNMHVNVRYKSGALMSYSLHSFMPWEGYIIYFNGSKGRLEHICQESVYFSGDGSVPGELVPEGTKIKVYPHFRSGVEVDIWKATGGHGGGDPLLLEDVLMPEKINDKYLRAADYRSGAWSILTGVAANRSMESGGPIHIKDIIKNLDEPDYPPMPSSDEPLSGKFGNETMPEWID